MKNLSRIAIVAMKFELSPEVLRFTELVKPLLSSDPPEHVQDAVARFVDLGNAAFELRYLDVADADGLTLAIDFSDLGIELASACFAGDIARAAPTTSGDSDA